MSTGAQRLLEAAEQAAQQLRRGDQAGRAAANAVGLVRRDLPRLIQQQASGGRGSLVLSVLSRPGEHTPEQIRRATRDVCDQLACAVSRQSSRTQGLALYEIIMAVAFVERSSLGTPAASRVRGLAATADVTAVIARLRQLNNDPVTEPERESGPAGLPAALQPGAGSAAAQPAASLLAADAKRATGASATSMHSRPRWDADQAVTVLYDRHYRGLTRLAVLLTSDVTIAEETVQDAFVTMHGAWRQLQDSDKALSYLTETVVSRSRSHRPARPNPGRQPDLSEGREASTQPEPHLVAALRALPPPQREALVLRYYADFPETQIASVMGISTRAVNNHITRGIFSLQACGVQLLRHGAELGRDA